MTKTEALNLFDGSVTALAKALGITTQAISQWSEDQIPEKQELRIRYELLPARAGTAPAAQRASS